MNFIKLWLSGLLTVSFSTVTFPQSTQSNTDAMIALTNVILIDGKGGPPQAGMTLVISGQHIKDIFKTGAKQPPAGASVRELRGHWVMPGLIDAHVHLTGRSDPTGINYQLRTLLLGGVTSVRDMGGDGVVLAELAKAANDPATPSPRISFSAVLAGPTWFSDPRAQSTAHGGTPGQLAWQRAVTRETNLKQVVAEAKAAGATGLKLYADLSPELLARITAEGRRQGLKVWSHAAIVPSKPSDALAAGVDTLSHALQLAFEFVPKLPAKVEDLDLTAMRASVQITPEGRDKLLRQMRDKRVMLDTTLIVTSSDPNDVRAQWAYGFTRRARELGVRVVAGTDAALANTNRPNLHRELELLVQHCGFSPLEAITAATRAGAEALGQEATLGMIAAGKLADLVILDQDPTQDIRHTASIIAVMKGGRWFQREQAVAADVQGYQAFIGQYEFSNGFSLTISLENGRLQALPKGSPKTALTHESGLTFQSDAPGNPRITFIKDARGQVSELILRMREREMRGKKPQQ